MSRCFSCLVIAGWISFSCLKVFATDVPCTENRTEACIQNLATFITLDGPKFVTEPELERLCREAEDGQKCSSDFLRSCENSKAELAISLQIGRSQGVSQMLCSTGGYITDPIFRQSYLKHSPCIAKHQERIKECYTSAVMLAEPELVIVKNSTKSAQEKYEAGCCPVVKYIECSENGIASSCGAESKSVVVNMLLKMAGKQLQEFCSNVDPKFPNSPAGCVSAGNRHLFSVWSYIIMIHITLVIIVLKELHL